MAFKTETLDAAFSNENEVAFHVYIGTSNQELVFVAKSTIQALCKKHNASRLVTYADASGTADHVRKGEKAIPVSGYVKKPYRYECPITGETTTEVNRSPRTINMFAR